MNPTATTGQPVTIQSFGYLHLRHPVPADFTLDLRAVLADPAHVPDGSLLDLDGRDPAVRDFVFATPGATALLDDTVQLAANLLRVKPSVIVAFGCAGGRHRSVALADALGAALTALGHTVVVEHLHVHLPRVIKPAAVTA